MSFRTRELARYAGQYRHATEALARLCRETADVAPESSRDEIAAHAAEEESHVGLWDDFVEAVGGEIGAEPTPETAECVTAWTAPDGYLAQLARMYAIESGQPEIARVKREGLTRFYGDRRRPRQPSTSGCTRRPITPTPRSPAG